MRPVKQRPWFISLLSSLVVDRTLRRCGIAEGGSATAFDRVAYDGGPLFPDADGAASQLDPASIDPIANDDGANWCEAVVPFGLGDRGTPGTLNPPCLVPRRL